MIGLLMPSAGRGAGDDLSTLRLWRGDWGPVAHSLLGPIGRHGYEQPHQRQATPIVAAGLAWQFSHPEPSELEREDMTMR